MGRGWLCPVISRRPEAGRGLCSVKRPLVLRGLWQGGSGGPSLPPPRRPPLAGGWGRRGIPGPDLLSCSMEGSHLAFLQGGWGVANESERLPALAVGVFPRCRCNSCVQDVQAPPASGLGQVLEDLWEKLSAASGSAGHSFAAAFPSLVDALWPVRARPVFSECP